jgi:hypothetical protein
MTGRANDCNDINPMKSDIPRNNISFVGLPGSDAQLLALAHSYERRSGRFVAPPAPLK